MKWLSSGCVLLNLALSGDPDKGYPFGRMVNLCGLAATGKTGLAVEAMIRCLRLLGDGEGLDVKVIYDETEAAFDLDYAERIGLPLDDDRLVVRHSSSVEDCFEALSEEIKNLKEDSYLLYVLDSLDALPAVAELSRDITEGSYGTEKAKQLSSFFRRIMPSLHGKNVLLFVVSQLRENVGVMFGDKYRRAGGLAPDYYASQIIRLTEAGHVKNGDVNVGLLIKAEIKKNKLYPPFKTVKFVWSFDIGLDDVATCFLYAKENGLIKRGGGWYKWKDKSYREDDLLNLFSENEEEWTELKKIVAEHWTESQNKARITRRKVL